MYSTTPHRAMRRSLNLILCLAFVTFSVAEADSAPIRVQIKFAADYPHNSAQLAGAYWRVQGAVTVSKAPIRNEREYMVVELLSKSAKAPRRPPVKIAIHDSMFDPPAIGVAPGTQIIFDNRDATTHMIAPAIESDDFMKLKSVNTVALFKTSFDKPGAYLIHSAEEPHMQLVIVASTGYTAAVNKNGVAALKDVKSGKYRLKVWHRNVLAHSEKVKIAGKSLIEIVLKGPAKKKTKSTTSTSEAGEETPADKPSESE